MLKAIYLTDRLFIGLGCCILAFLISYSFPVFFWIGQICLVAVFIIALLEGIILYRIKDQLSCLRQMSAKLSLGDLQDIMYTIDNKSVHALQLELVDELPYQLQKRDFRQKRKIRSRQEIEIHESIRPLIRGQYQFSASHLYISLPTISFVQYRVTFPNEKEVMVIPSIIQMRKYELEVFSKTATLSGIRRIRTIGENDEFEHIRLYQQGDNIKSINWKATSRQNQLMINQYQNSRSQMVYSVIDKGRSMKMPFDGLTLLDYSINAALVISNIILKKYDKAGLITFSDLMGKIVGAENSTQQLGLIAKELYNQKTNFKESNYELLYYTLQQRLRRRSILLFFTNFEHHTDLDRNLEYLRALARNHLLIVIFFVNTELVATSEITAETIEDIHLKTFAARALMEKEVILNKLRLHGIQAILTKPEDLSIQVINKYLELKAKRMR